MDLWIAANRFGLAEPSLATIKANTPQQWVLKQLRPDLLVQTAPRVDWSAENFPGGSSPSVPWNQLFQEHFYARLGHYSKSRVPVLERLTLFWANHFTVAARQRDKIAPFEFQAIRPNILGSFADLCFAATTHSAMLSYLSNSTSAGPNSVVGKSGKRALNENLGRELLELHTVGLAARYTQNDVIEMAKVLTGWRGRDKEDRGAGVFDPRSHEPGPKTVLGKTYKEAGGEELRAVIEDLARHPATAKAIAMKLCKYMVSRHVRHDSSLVNAVRDTFLDSGGDLSKTYRTLFSHPEAWAEHEVLAHRNLRLPDDYVIAIFRVFDFGDLLEGKNSIRGLLRQFGFNALLGQPYGKTPGPDGWSMDPSVWMSSDLAFNRAKFAYMMGTYVERLGDSVYPSTDPAKLVDEFFPPDLFSKSAEIIRQAATPEQAYALAFMAPEFLRRA